MGIYTWYAKSSSLLWSAAESEIGAGYMTNQESVPMRTCLVEMGHPQPPTFIQVDNATAVGFANKTIKQKWSKAIYMRFYWLQDRCNQGKFVIYWAPGADNLADYYTKHQPPSHHKKTRPNILHSAHFTQSLIYCLLRGCFSNPNTITPLKGAQWLHHRRAGARDRVCTELQDTDTNDVIHKMTNWQRPQYPGPPSRSPHDDATCVMLTNCMYIQNPCTHNGIQLMWTH